MYCGFRLFSQQYNIIPQTLVIYFTILPSIQLKVPHYMLYLKY